jgi:hypothetical protein
VAISCSTASHVTSICYNTYGSLTILKCYGDDRKDEAENHISFLYLYSNVIAPFIFLLMGYSSDRIKIWKLLSLVNLFCGGSQILMIYNLYHNDCNIGYLFDACFIMVMSTYACNYMASCALIIKIVNKRTRGTMLALNA